ncbi:MAG: hypothetical protein ABIL44_07905 [candidate division WOR-3 bacterium]
MPKADFIEPLQLINKLHETPKDDWDLKRRYFSIINSDGKMKRYYFNPFDIDYQVRLFFMRKYGNKRDKIKAHMFRYWAVAKFFREHMSKLKRMKLIRKTDAGYELISESLIESLCVLPFSEKRIINGIEDYAFSYEAVVKKAKEIEHREK